MNTPNGNTGPVEHPRGIYGGRVDEKGRIKLPSAFQQYLAAVGETKVFVTSFEGRIGRIYPISVWKQNEELLANAGEDAEAAEDILFVANDLGGDAEMDAQGRLLVPAELRRALGIENQPVRLQHSKGHVKFFSEAVYEERRRHAMDNAQAKLQTMEKRGLR